MSHQPEAYPTYDADTKLMNIHHLSDYSEADIYIGPESPELKDLPDSVEIDFQNPFSVAKYGRKGSVVNFKMYFYSNFLNDREFRQKVQNLEGKTICDTTFPKYGHGQVIIHFYNKMDSLRPEELLEYIREDIRTVDEQFLVPEGFDYREEAFSKISEVMME